MELITHGDYVIEIAQREGASVRGRVWQMPAARPISEFQLSNGSIAFTASFPFRVRRGLSKAIRRGVRNNSI